MVLDVKMDDAVQTEVYLFWSLYISFIAVVILFSISIYLFIEISSSPEEGIRIAILLRCLMTKMMEMEEAVEEKGTPLDPPALLLEEVVSLHCEVTTTPLVLPSKHLAAPSTAHLQLDRNLRDVALLI